MRNGLTRNGHLLRVAAAMMLALAGGAHAAAQAPDTLESLPGYERYEAVQAATRTLRTGGRISEVEWADDGTELRFRRGREQFRMDLDTLQLEPIDAAEDGEDGNGGNARSRPRRVPRGRQRDRETSPDGNWVAIARDWNIVLQRADDLGGEIAVTTDGSRKHRYGQASWVYGEELRQTEAMWWSPDSRMLVFYEFDEHEVRDFHLVKGWTDLRTDALVEGYPKPGEPNPRATLRIYDVAKKTTIAADVNVEADHYIYGIRFTPNGDAILVSRTNRHQDVLELLAVDPATGAARVLLTEWQPCWQDNSPPMRFLTDGDRFIWQTERSGYRHFDLRDLDGNLLAALTRGEHPDGAIEHVDEGAGLVFYTSFSGENPLSAQIHRVNLDGTGMIGLTDDALHHALVSASPGGRWFIARAEALGEPPVTTLHDERGEVVAVLAETDTTNLEPLDLQPPELFVFKADDGRTDLYGWLYKPSNFDPTRSYPLLIDVYGGPLSQGVHNTFRPAYPQCEFGFLVAKIDNRGTTGRGKAFECATYLKLGDVDLQDQVDGVRYLAGRPYVDGDRVGIFGHSYGGYMAALAILKHPDVFHVAVAGSPVTDWRNYDTIYTERFMRTPAENSEGYEAGSCMTFAEQIRGRLLLMHGMVDDNVHPNNTWQLVARLQKAEKPFDMMLFPDNGHRLGAWSSTRRWLYLYEHLIHTPPAVPPQAAIRIEERGGAD